MKSYKGRRCDVRRPVEVYRNLNRGGWSVRQDGRVVAHAAAIMLASVRFVVRAAGWHRALRDHRRNVHAWAVGLVTSSGMGTNAVEADRLRRIRYSLPHGVFCHDLTSLPVWERQVRGAQIVAFNSRGAFGAYFS